MEKVDIEKRNFIRLLPAVALFGGAMLCSACQKNGAKINYRKCVNCGRCEKACPNGAIYTKNGKVRVDGSRCNECAVCVYECKYGAISV